MTYSPSWLQSDPKIKTELEKRLDKRLAELERRISELEEKKMQDVDEHYVHID